MMKINVIILLSFILLTGVTTSGWCKPELVYIEKGLEKRIDGIEDLKPYYIEDGEKKYFTEGGTCFLRKNDEDILSFGYATVNYIVKYDNRGSLNAIVSIGDSAKEYGWNRIQIKSFLKLWDKDSINNAFFFLCWYEPKSDLLPIGNFDVFPYYNDQLHEIGLSVDIKSKEIGGFPVIFIWKDGKLIPPKSFGADYVEFFHSIILGQMERFDKTEKTDSLYNKEDMLGNKAIHYAAAFGHADILKKLLVEGTKIDDRNENRMTPLLLASATDHKNIVDLLLKYKADIKSQDNDKRTALHYASYCGNEAIAKELIEYDKNVNRMDVLSRLPIMYAIDESNDSIVGLLASKNAKLPSDKENKQLVLLGSVSKDNHNTVTFLLDHDTNANEEIFGTTPLIVAAGSSSLEVVTLLINSGAKVNKSNNKQITPLLSACLTGRLEVVKYLLEKGANVNTQSETGLSVLEVAVLRNDPEMIDMLISYGVDIETKDKSGRTPFWIAALLGHRKSMKKLLDAGARCDLNHENAIELMELAFRYDMPEAVELALNQCLNADFYFYDKYPSTWIAEYYSADEILDLLIAHGAKKDKGEGLGLTALKDISEKPKIREATPIYYPQDLKRKYGSRKFVVQVIINEQGRILFPKMVDSEVPELDRIVMETITKWHFTIPKNLSGEACSMIANIPILLECEDIEKRTWELSEIDQMPHVIKSVPLKYPTELEAQRIQGRVQLSLIVDETGTPVDIKIESLTHKGFADAAIAAVKEFRFSPGYYQGKPVKVRVHLPVEYKF